MDAKSFSVFILTPHHYTLSGLSRSYIIALQLSSCRDIATMVEVFAVKEVIASS